ncbi:hypothetical protein FB556_0668 [Enteractinococcus coprophilus]|uniref:Uncharacterized protein n=1 Tax=Enteractinococcus coprophilus TaxID=1027633 RepID=A0A543ANR0_9MICC|nr:hypothetical protein FB556_0668 [Enteractinococcus coprophilus]
MHMGMNRLASSVAMHQGEGRCAERTKRYTLQAGVRDSPRPLSIGISLISKSPLVKNDWYNPGRYLGITMG